MAGGATCTGFPSRATIDGEELQSRSFARASGVSMSAARGGSLPSSVPRTTTRWRCGARPDTSTTRTSRGSSRTSGLRSQRTVRRSDQGAKGDREDGPGGWYVPRPVEEVRHQEARDGRAEEPGGGAAAARPDEARGPGVEDHRERCASQAELRPALEREVVGEADRRGALVADRGHEERERSRARKRPILRRVDGCPPEVRPAVGEARYGFGLG